MDPDAVYLLCSRTLHAFATTSSKARGVERVRRDDVNLIAVGCKLLGEVPDQSRGAVHRRKVRLRDEDERSVSQIARHAVHCSGTRTIFSPTGFGLNIMNASMADTVSIGSESLRPR